MSRIWSMMDVGKRTMMNSQSALQTVSHNVANKSTEGFSRQRVEIQTNEPVGVGKLRIGMGARPGITTRTNNPHLERQLEQEGNNLGFSEGRTSMLGRVEQVYNEQINKGLNQFMGEFFNSMRELANNPESLATRTMVKESAEFLTKDFKRINNQLSDIQKDADYRIQTKIEEINQMSREIASLNEKVQMVEMQGVPANDERDRRDLLLKKMSAIVNIKYAEGDSGSLTITAGNNAVLVSGHSSRDLFVAASAERDGKQEGNFDIFYKSTENGTPVLMTKQFNGGEVGGLIDVRDRMINRMKGDLDNVAYTLAKEVNMAHIQGYDQYSKKAGLFFDMPQTVEGASATLKVDESVSTDVGRIAAAGQPGSPGDNRIANIMSSLQYKKTLQDGASTLDDFYSSIVGQIGIETQRANSDLSSQKDIVDQLKNLRESISGVSLDEETTKMIEFQKTFDASARLIRTADEMMDTVLNLKRM